MTVAASVASAPVTNKARTIVAPSGAGVPVTAVHTDAAPPIPLGLPGSTAWRTPSIHQVTGLTSPSHWSGAGSTPSGNTTPVTRNIAPANASGYDQLSWRVCRQTAARRTPIARIGTRPSTSDTTSSGHSIAVTSTRRPSTMTENTRATTVPIAPAPSRAAPRPTSSTRNVAGLTYRYLSIRYRSRSSSTVHAGPEIPATSVAHSADPSTT